MPLKELFLITAASVIAQIIARRAWHEGVAYGRKDAEKDVQLAVLRGMATVRLNDARSTDIITEIHKAC
jgi:hypothetical protein